MDEIQIINYFLLKYYFSIKFYLEYTKNKIIILQKKMQQYKLLNYNKRI